ncbi:hypothetical protein SASPL_111771 [Salvia splendens]|uniref:Uncharacterized protein n=1 Tax=Salvia splendens TaxID=180675 RepID=A0A8X8Y8Q0_SALSN|nr:uncharacterized protein LOC121800807 [Salvia splendens]KAG6427525.1 hypothetical protein SASPL_111771 [Salvia splendens]
MGNCLVLEQKSVISVMKTDGEIIEYKAPIKVHQILCEYSHHAITDKLPVVKHLHPNTELIRGRLYYLLPLPVPAKKKKRVRFSDDVVEEEKRRGAGAAVRIKVVISKKELQAMLAKEGVSVEEVISEVRKEPLKIDSKSIALKGLESIPELD